MSSDQKKKTLASLLAGEALPFDAAALEAARAHARGERDDAAGVSALPEPLALAVIEAAVYRRAVGLLDALSHAPEKSVAKAAKRAVYRLRSAGVEVATAEPAGAPSPAAEPEDVPPSLVSPVTGNGERALILIRPMRGALEAAHLLVSDESGVLELSLREISRGNWRKQLKDMGRRKPPIVLELPLTEAKALLAEAVAMSARAHTPHPPGLADLLRHLELEAAVPPELPAPQDGDARLRLESARLRAEPEIAQWLPGEGDLQRLAQKYQEVLRSPLALSDAQKNDQLRQAFRSVSDEFAQAHRALYARRLAAMARYFEGTGRPEQARIGAAEARLLAHRDAPSPFIEELFFKVMRLTEQLAPAPTPPEPGPGSGLILP
jgi:hypothetical protein